MYEVQYLINRSQLKKTEWKELYKTEIEDFPELKDKSVQIETVHWVLSAVNETQVQTHSWEDFGKPRMQKVSSWK